METDRMATHTTATDAMAAHTVATHPESTPPTSTMAWREVRPAHWARMSIVVLALAVAGRAPAEPRPLAPSAMGFIAADILHADLALTGLPLVTSPTVSLLTAGIEVGAVAPGSGAPEPESPIKKRARERREAAERAAARRTVAPRRVAPAAATEVRDEARVAQPQPAARRKRLFDNEERSVFETAVPKAPAPQLSERQHCRPHVDRVSIRAEATFLSRDGSSSFLLAQSVSPAGLADGRTTLALDGVQPIDGSSGFRTAVLYRCSPHDAVEVSYFGSNVWNRSSQLNATASSPVQSPFLGTTIGTADDSFNNAILATYSSQVHDGELNWLRAFDNGERPNMRYILGLRWLTFRDDLELQGSAAGGLAERTRVVADNALVGPQIGVDYRHRIVDHLDYGFVAKGGLVANFARQKTTNVSGPAPAGVGTTNFAAAASETKTGGLLDGLAQLMFHPCPNFMIRAGYQVVYAQQLALAPENTLRLGTALRDAPAVPLPATLGAGVDTSGTLWLHGAFVGGEVRF